MSSSPEAKTRTLSRSLHRALTLLYKIIVRLTSVLKSKNLSSGFQIVLKTIQLISAAAIDPRLLVMQHSRNLSQVQLTEPLSEITITRQVDFPRRASHK